MNVVCFKNQQILSAYVVSIALKIQQSMIFTLNY